MHAEAFCGERVGDRGQVRIAPAEPDGDLDAAGQVDKGELTRSRRVRHAPGPAERLDDGVVLVSDTDEGESMECSRRSEEGQRKRAAQSMAHTMMPESLPGVAEHVEHGARPGAGLTWGAIGSTVVLQAEEMLQIVRAEG